MMADMQRARLIAGELPKFGWEAEILTPEASFQTDFSRVQGGGMEFPEVPVHEVAQWRPGLFRALGSRNVGIRATMPMRWRGLEVLQSGRFDLVYFTTTKHWLTCNGAFWRRRTGVPYIADVHDPLFIKKKVYFVSRNRIKERIAKHLGRVVERLAVGRADGLVSVSEGYVEDLRGRYPQASWNTSNHVLVQPFPADMPALHQMADGAPREGAGDIVYIGAGGNIMERGWREFLRCLTVSTRKPLPAIDILGTDTTWREGGRRYLQDIAGEFGLGSTIREEPARISYRDSIVKIRSARGLLVLGVDDPHYRPSKLHTYLATGAPLLVTLHAESPLRTILAVPGVHIVVFGPGEDCRERNVREVDAYLADVAAGKRWETGRTFLEPEESARVHARLFETVRVSRGHAKVD